MVITRADKPPGHLVAALGLPARAKILAAASLPAEAAWLVAADLGLGVVGEGRRQFHPWDLIERATLRRDGAVLAITYADSRQTEEFALRARDKRFASVVNERLRASVVEVEHVPAGAGQVAVALRRRPADGAVYLQELPGSDADPASAAPLIRAARARLGEAAGLPSGTW
ncbi:MAG: hypothetical protein LBD70_01460 [Bifidobacteriaceae bacterium]|jgi:hypothetical protein|nr:hypothetical protein [Bifidobacteriaceae bacterium]